MKKTKKAEKKKEKGGRFGRAVYLTVSIAFLVVLIVLMVGLVKQLHQFGYELFAEKPGNGVDVVITFTVEEGESASTTARRLKAKNLISNEWRFLLQMVLFDKDILAGPHELSSNMTTQQILDALSTPMEKVDDY